MNEWLPATAGAAAGGLLVGLACRLVRHRHPRVEQLPTPHPVVQQPQEETWELLNEEGRILLDAQRLGGERIETKAALVIGAALAAVQFVAREPRTSYWLPAAISAYWLSISFGLICVRPRTFDSIGLERVIRGVWWYPRGYAAAELVNNRNQAVKANARRHRTRVAWFWLSLAALGVGAMMSTTHLTLGKPTDERLNGTCIESDVDGTFLCTADS